jgi:hypothetical protein
VVDLGEGVDIFGGESRGAHGRGGIIAAAGAAGFSDVNLARGDSDSVGVDDAGNLVLDGLFDALADRQNRYDGRDTDDDAEHSEE